jgi:16S rRNA (uracil1498-N3)-methyltransferase
MTVYRLVIAPEQENDGQIILTPEQKHYLYRVLRLKAGDSFIAIDGMGGVWNACVMDGYAQITDKIVETNELSLTVTLIAALPKGNGFDDVVRACTELGVVRILPIVSQRTLLKPSDNKLERWRKIATEAAEQAERQIIPKIAVPTDLTAAIAALHPKSNRFLCVARGNPPHLLDCLLQKPYLDRASNSFGDREIVVAIGSEGGWTEAEITEANAGGFQSVSLGKRVLRAITAPMAAISLIAGVLDCRRDLV